MNNDRLVEAVSRLTAERDALRRKEQETEAERERAKVKIRQIAANEKQKRTLLERKVSLLILVQGVHKRKLQCRRLD